MSKKKIFTLNQAKTIGEQLSIRWDKFDVPQFRAGFGVELEHDTVNQRTKVTDDDPLVTGKIALAHLSEFPDYGLASKKRTQKLCHFLVSWFGFRSQWATDSRGNYGGVGGCKRSR